MVEYLFFSVLPLLLPVSFDLAHVPVLANFPIPPVPLWCVCTWVSVCVHVCVQVSECVCTQVSACE